MDPEVLTANGQLQHDEDIRERDGSRGRQFSVDSQLWSQAASKTHVAPFCMSEWAIESRFQLLFSEPGREEYSSGRNDAPGLRVL